jgi:SagB-type dehydrogenase family enzyme
MLSAWLLVGIGCLEAAPDDVRGVGMQTLPDPNTKGTVSVEETLARRRSVRAFRSDPLTAQQVSQLLWAAQGITQKRRGFRTAPSAGATYPLNTYLVTADGVFLYEPQRHALRLKRKGDIRKALCDAALSQPSVRQAPASIVFTAVYERTTNRYGARGRQYVHMEAGHAAENVHLQAVALGLGSVPVGAFDDDDVARLLSLGRNERPLYIIPVGRPH